MDQQKCASRKFTAGEKNLMDDTYPDLDVQYSPSRWSRRLCACQILQRHVAFATKESQLVREKIKGSLDVPYGPNPGEKLDIFGTDLATDAPICVFVHGGFWQDLSKDLSSYAAVQLHKNHFKTIIIGYDLCPNVTLNEITIEIQRSFDYVANYANRNKSRGIYLIGHSAGAHLIANLLCDAKEDFRLLLKQVHLISGVYDLRPLIKTYVNDKVRMNAREAESLSPQLRWTDAEMQEEKKQKQKKKKWPAKIFVIYAEHDSEAFKRQSKSFHLHLSSQGLERKSQLIEIRAKDHFDVLEDFIKDDHPIIKLLLRADSDGFQEEAFTSYD